MNKLIFAAHTIKYGHLYIKNLEYEKTNDLRENNRDLEGYMQISNVIEETWWKNHIKNGFNPINDFDF